MILLFENKYWKAAGIFFFCVCNLPCPSIISNDQQSVISQLVLCYHRVLPGDECSPLGEENRAWMEN